MIGIVAGDNVDLAQNIVLVLTAVGQWRKEINVGVGDDGDQLLPVGAEIGDYLPPADKSGFGRLVRPEIIGEVRPLPTMRKSYLLPGPDEIIE